MGLSWVSSSKYGTAWACRRNAPPGSSGFAPCRLRCHGPSARSFTPTRLRRCALRLPPGDSPADSPRRAWLGAPRYRRTGMRRIGPASAPLQREGRWRTRWRLLRQVAPMRAVLNAGSSRPSRHEGRLRPVHVIPARHRHGTSSPRVKTGAAKCGGGVLACRRVVDLAPVSGRAGAAFMRGCRVGHISLRCGSAQGVLVSL